MTNMIQKTPGSLLLTSALVTSALGGACIGTQGEIHRSTAIQETQETGRAMADYQRRRAQPAPQPAPLPDRMSGGEGGGGGGGGGH